MHPLLSQASGLTHDVIGAAIEVHKDKGPELLESVYEWCMARELQLRGHKVSNQEHVTIRYKALVKNDFRISLCSPGRDKGRDDSILFMPTAGLAKISADKCSVIAAVKIRTHITSPLERVFIAEVNEIPNGLTGNWHGVEELSLMIGEIGTLILAYLR
jgi:hypothetical protein